MKEIKRPYRVKDMSGERYGRLLVLGTDGYFYNKENKPYCIAWKCKCDCGNIVRHSRSNLKSGEIKSCGCYFKEINKDISKTHGLSKTRIYFIYYSMINRCYNQKEKTYFCYGGRGIEVCQEWRDDFVNFYNWAMENGYEDNLSLERINVNGNYAPSNCKWIPFKYQAHNKRNNVVATETQKSIAYENSLVGIVSEHVAMNRYTKYGWDLYDSTHVPKLTKGIHFNKWLAKNPEYLKQKEIALSKED